MTLDPASLLQRSMRLKIHSPRIPLPPIDASRSETIAYLRSEVLRSSDLMRCYRPGSPGWKHHQTAIILAAEMLQEARCDHDPEALAYLRPPPLKT